jgi:hypothetical protein
MKKLMLGLLLMLMVGFSTAQAGVSFSIGTGDFYLSVGDYDYLPYTYNYNAYNSVPRVSFYNMMSDYGQWVSVSPFGQVWRPYAESGWRPYVHGHWDYTQYGPTWVGYEPWAWAGYHYGNWIWSQQFGWVWIPGYEWHPGRVAWAQGYNSIGWMPLPPANYDYSRGHLGYQGGQYNQFTYNDPNFDYGNDYYGSNQDYGNNQGGYNQDYGYNQGYGNDSYSYGGPYYDSRYRGMYYNQGFQSLAPNLWVFVNTSNFNNDNYADSYLDQDYTRNLFDRRLIRISSRPLQRIQLERIVRQRVREVPVEVRQIQTDKQLVKVVIPMGEEDHIRRNANRTVQEVIAPAFAQKQKTFKGLRAKNEVQVAKIFHQENVQPKIQTVAPEVIVQKGMEFQKNRELRRRQFVQKQVEEVKKVEKEGKIREHKGLGENEKPVMKDRESQQPRQQPPMGKTNRERQFNPGSDQSDKVNRDRQIENQQNQKESIRQQEQMKQEQMKQSQLIRERNFKKQQDEILLQQQNRQRDEQNLKLERNRQLEKQQQQQEKDRQFVRPDQNERFVNGGNNRERDSQSQINTDKRKQDLGQTTKTLERDSNNNERALQMEKDRAKNIKESAQTQTTDVKKKDNKKKDRNHNNQRDGQDNRQ